MNMRTKQNKQIKQSKQWTLGIIAGTLVLTLAVLCGYELWSGWRGRSANGVRSGVPQFMLPWKRLAAGTSSGGTIAPQIPPAEFPGAIALLKPPPAAQLPAMWRQPATVRVTLPSRLSAAKPIHFPNDKPSDPQPVDSKATLPSWLTTEGPIHFTHDKLPGSSRQIGVLASKPVVIPDFRMRFVTAMCLDQQGHIWIATEGDGVWCYDPAASAGQRYVGFDVENTDGQLGNNDIDAIACDNHNRIWAGTLNHGVSVYNGQCWQDYDMVRNPEQHVLAGPLGSHVFALRFDPYTNQMWICTDAGISIYQCSTSDTDMAPGANGADIGVPGLVNHGQDVHATIHHSPNSRLPTPISTTHGKFVVRVSRPARSDTRPASTRRINPPANIPHNLSPVTYRLSPVTFVPGTWHYITQANGLPQNPDCIAFAPNGTVYIGTQCSGIAIGIPASRLPTPDSRLGYRWHIITGPWKMPLTAMGKGLPSNLINCLAIEPNGSVIAGTDGGIAFGKPASPTGRSVSLWTFLHGQDFPAKVRGLWHLPVDWQVPSEKVLATLPTSDYITVLALTDQKTGTERSSSHLKTPDPRLSYLWIGHRRGGCDVWELDAEGKVIQRRTAAGTAFSSFITCLLPLPGGKMAMGTYGGGMRMITLPGTKNAWIATPGDGVAGTTNLHIAAGSAGGHRADSGTPITMHEPKPAALPTQEQLTTLADQLTAAFRIVPSQQPGIVPITDDWRMQGTWLGRYGRYWACLFACSSPFDYVWAPGPLPLHHTEGIGPHHRLHDDGRYHLPDGDTIRYHMTWLSTANKRVLELPEVYLDQCIADHTATRKSPRRQAEIDDHGENYIPTFSGPDIYVYLHIPPGAYTLSLYFFNKDGHGGNSPTRDYVLSVIKLPLTWRLDTPLGPQKIAVLVGMTGIAHSRVVNFWGGVWKRFIVRGPMKLAIRVAKNDSLDTILSSAMLDPLAEHPAPYYYGQRAWRAHEKQQTEIRRAFIAAWRNGELDATLHNSSPVKLAQGLLQMIDALAYDNPTAWAANEQLAYTDILRWCITHYETIPRDPQAAKIVEKCYYHLGLFQRWEALEKSRGILTSRQIEKGLWKIVKPLRLYQPEGPSCYRGLEAKQIRWYLRHFSEKDVRTKGLVHNATTHAGVEAKSPAYQEEQPPGQHDAVPPVGRGYQGRAPAILAPQVNAVGGTDRHDEQEIKEKAS